MNASFNLEVEEEEEEVVKYDLDLDLDLEGFELQRKSSCQQFESTWVLKQNTSPLESGCNKGEE